MKNKKYIVGVSFSGKQLITWTEQPSLKLAKIDQKHFKASTPHLPHPIYKITKVKIYD